MKTLSKIHTYRCMFARESLWKMESLIKFNIQSAIRMHPNTGEEKLTNVDDKMVIQLWNVFSNWCSSYETDSWKLWQLCKFVFPQRNFLMKKNLPQRNFFTARHILYSHRWTQLSAELQNKRNVAISWAPTKNILNLSCRIFSKRISHKNLVSTPKYRKEFN